MSESTLIVLMSSLMGPKIMGVITQGNSGNLSFIYDENWTSNETPLSLSMPHVVRRHGDTQVRNFLWGLLPDNEEVLKRIGRDHHVSPRNPFALLSAIGEDCAGAVQFVTPDRLEFVETGGGLTPISTEEIAEDLRSLRETGASSRPARKDGAFSLAGAQPKIALTFMQGKWWVPSGRMATTHILKPPSTSHKGQIENEHFCLQLANTVGLVTSKSEILQFGDEVAIVSTRYDRRVLSEDPPVTTRSHQEDMCQALSLPPEKKYEKDGGPGVVEIMQLLAGSGDPSEDRDRFMQAIAFNFIIKGTDAHAKNYSILHGGQRFRLAPLYDIASVLPYDFDPRELRSSMRIGKYYFYEDIMPRHWEEMARRARYDADAALAHIRNLTAALPDLASDLAKAQGNAGVNHQVIETLVEAIAQRCGALRKIYGAEEAAPPAEGFKL